MVKHREVSLKHRSSVLAAVTDLFNLSMNTWISVRDHSIHDILEINGVHKMYATILVEVLERMKLLKTRGVRTGLEYMILTDIIPDMSSITDECISIVKGKQYAYAEKADRRKSSDLVQKVTPDQKDESKKSGKAIITTKEVARRPLQIGDIRYMIHDNIITEVRVFVISESLDGSGILCSVAHHNPKEVESSWTNDVIDPSDLFISPEALIPHLMSTTSRYVRRNPKEVVTYL